MLHNQRNIETFSSKQVYCRVSLIMSDFKSEHDSRPSQDSAKVRRTQDTHVVAPRAFHVNVPQNEQVVNRQFGAAPARQILVAPRTVPVVAPAVVAPAVVAPAVVDRPLTHQEREEHRAFMASLPTVLVRRTYQGAFETFMHQASAFDAAGSRAEVCNCNECDHCIERNDHEDRED
jgi:hypothetical protein